MSICKLTELQSKWKLCAVGLMERVVISTWGLQEKNWQSIFLHLMTFFVTLDLEERHQLSDFLGVAE